MKLQFTDEVYKIVAKIPKGQVLTYKEVAALAGRPNACRAVGNILNKNRNPLVPCHRVVRSDGVIGGYAWGSELKIQRLTEEGYLKNKILDQAFFNRPTLKVAEDLIGKTIVRKYTDPEKGEQVARLQINEVEAYDGPNDLACHASKGCTDRTKIMFGEAGYIYVYLCYGMHWLINIVTGPKKYPSAVLLRGAGDLDGPAKLTKFLLIDKSLNTKLAHPCNGLWFEDNGIKINSNNIKKAPRIGVNYAGPFWSKVPYRYILKRQKIKP
jgi:DNA-3-methyladenine glycosylase